MRLAYSHKPTKQTGDHRPRKGGDEGDGYGAFVPFHPAPAVQRRNVKDRFA